MSMLQGAPSLQAYLEQLPREQRYFAVLEVVDAALVGWSDWVAGLVPALQDDVAAAPLHVTACLREWARSNARSGQLGLLLWRLKYAILMTQSRTANGDPLALVWAVSAPYHVLHAAIEEDLGGGAEDREPNLGLAMIKAVFALDASRGPDAAVALVAEWRGRTEALVARARMN